MASLGHNELTHFSPNQDDNNLDKKFIFYIFYIFLLFYFSKPLVNQDDLVYCPQTISSHVALSWELRILTTDTTVMLRRYKNANIL